MVSLVALFESDIGVQILPQPVQNNIFAQVEAPADDDLSTLLFSPRSSKIEPIESPLRTTGTGIPVNTHRGYPKRSPITRNKRVLPPMSPSFSVDSTSSSPRSCYPPVGLLCQGSPISESSTSSSLPPTSPVDVPSVLVKNKISSRSLPPLNQISFYNQSCATGNGSSFSVYRNKQRDDIYRCSGRDNRLKLPSSTATSRVSKVSTAFVGKHLKRIQEVRESLRQSEWRR